MTAPDPSALILFRREGRPPKNGELASAVTSEGRTFVGLFTGNAAEAVTPIPAAEALERQVNAVLRELDDSRPGCWCPTRAGLKKVLLAALLGPPDEPPEWARECARTAPSRQNPDALARHIARFAPGGES